MAPALGFWMSVSTMLSAEPAAQAVEAFSVRVITCPETEGLPRETPLVVESTAGVPVRTKPVGKVTLIKPPAGISVTGVKAIAAFPVTDATRDAGTTVLVPVRAAQLQTRVKEISYLKE